MKYIFFDFEVYPHWWCLVHYDWEEEGNEFEVTQELLNEMRTHRDKYTNRMEYVTSEQKDAKKAVYDILTSGVVFGYNIRHYDLLIAEAIFRGFTPEQIREVNDEIIKQNVCRFAPPSMITYQDLRDDTDGSLKDKEGLLGLDIVDAPFSFDKENLSGSDKLKLIEYCMWDVFSEFYYFLAVARPYVNTKLKVADMFDVPHKTAFVSSNMKLVSMILTKKDAKPRETTSSNFNLPKYVSQYIERSFSDDKELLDSVLNNTKGETFTGSMFGNTVTFGDGGLHSVRCNNLLAESDSEYMIMNFDAEAYYPSLMLYFRVLDPDIIDEPRFASILEERLRLKHEKGKDKEEEKALKVLCNTVYGATGNKYSSLYAPDIRSFTCRLGQILIAALAEHLYRYEENLTVLQVNTDSVMCMFPRRRYHSVQSTVEEWERITDVHVSSEEIKRIWQKDVNDYLLTRPNGAVKTRGAWLCREFFNLDTQCLRSPVAPVCARAAVSWLLWGADPLRYIRECKDPMAFVIPCRKGIAYDGMIRMSTRFKEFDMGRFSRVYASKNANIGGAFHVKIEEHGKKKERKFYRVPNTPDSCAIVNLDMSSMPFETIGKDIDYQFYFRRVKELLSGDWQELVAGEFYKTKLYDGGRK